MKARRSNIATVCKGLLATLLLIVSPVWAASPQLIQVEVGTHQLLKKPEGVSRVAVGDAAIADVNVINGRELLITGKGLGVTSLLVWPQRGAVQEYRIRVGAVVDPLAAGRLPNLLARRSTAPGAGGGIVEGDTQVMTEIKIAEVSRTTAQQYGLQFFKNSANTTAGIAPPGVLSGVTAGTNGFNLQSGSGFVPLQNAFNLVFGNSTRNFLGVLSLLEGKGLARVLAEPSLTATSGQTASFLAGGEFPIPVSQGGGGGSAAAITIEYKEFGVRLNLTPTVLSKDRISLKVAPEVSDLDFSAGIQISGVAVPALNVRRTDTTVELGDGESFVISGLVSNNLAANVSKLPWLGNIPILGAFFKTTTNNRTEKELIMVVTPHLVRPIARGATVPALPGQRYDNYRPGSAGLILEETGEFDTSQYGFSR